LHPPLWDDQRHVWYAIGESDRGRSLACKNCFPGPRGLDGWKALTCSSRRCFLNRLAEPSPTALGLLLYSCQTATCATGALSCGMPKRAVQRVASSRNCSAILLIVGMGFKICRWEFWLRLAAAGAVLLTSKVAAPRTVRPLLPKRRSAGRLAISSGWPSVSEKRASLLTLD
jgi:hypothetical protein